MQHLVKYHCRSLTEALDQVPRPQCRVKYIYVQMVQTQKGVVCKWDCFHINGAVLEEVLLSQASALKS